MAAAKQGSSEIKTQFFTKEGCYKLMSLSEYSRPNRVPYSVQQCQPVRVSLVTVNDSSGCGDRIAFNVGRELYFYIYKGVRKAADLTRPLDRRVYKGTIPTCHDFNLITRSQDCLELLVGFSAGQIQLLDPVNHELNKLYNEDRAINKSKVTCIKWVPGSENLFLVSHESGHMYVYNKDWGPGTGAPQYTPYKRGPGYSVEVCKNKTPRNPLYQWSIGEGSINEFSFSPDCKHIAIVTEDGFLRVFDFDAQILLGVMKSYFGSLLCTCWSPDGKYIVTGGEDDLVTVWSFYEKRVIARGEGHQSWVSVVSFDPYTTSVSGGGRMDESDEEELDNVDTNEQTEQSNNSTVTADDRPVTSYRFGSVGQDTMLLLWDLSEDILKPLRPRGRSMRLSTVSGCPTPLSNSLSNGPLPGEVNNVHSVPSELPPKVVSASSQTHKLTKSLEEIITSGDHQPGNRLCPAKSEIPILEPLIAKKIAHERLTSLVFKEDCIITACQEGFICTWARPGKVGVQTSGTVV